MWFTAIVGANDRLKTTTFKLFDKQADAEAHANAQTDEWEVACFYFATPGGDVTKKWRYRTTTLKQTGSWAAGNFKRTYPANNNADFTP
jgi:hypothetical protein